MLKHQVGIGALFLSVLLVPVFGEEVSVVAKLDAWAELRGPVRVRWITGPLTKARVEYGAAQEALTRAVEEDPNSLRGSTNSRDAGTGWANNHRADLPRRETWPVFLRISGTTREGKPFQSETVRVDDAKPPVGRTARASIPIAVHPGDWKLDRLPITFGVPFPQGELVDSANVRLLCGSEELPCQVAEVNRWRMDQSLRWVRIDTLVPRSAASLTLEYGMDVKRVVTAPPEAKPQPVPESVLTNSDGKVLRAKVTAESTDEGPAKTETAFGGHYVAEDSTELCAPVLRRGGWWHAGLTRTDYTFENDNTAAEFTPLKSLVVEWPLEGVPEVVTVGTGDDTVALHKGERVLQREDFEWVQEPGTAKGKRLQGVVELGGGRFLVVRNFWQQWPISVERRENSIVIGLCPELPAGFYASRPDEDKLYYQVRDGLHTFRQGFSKTWEIWTVSGDATVAASLTGERPIAAVPPEWIEKAGVSQKLAVAVRDQFPGYDETLASGIERYAEARERPREFGMMNFGDWYGERTWNWGNLEYDTGHGFLTQFMRTGKPEFYRRAEECIVHERDVDTRHYAADACRVGQQWTHCMGHTAGYYPKDYKDMKVYASPGWSDNRGHIWCQGMFEHYLLGGDRRSWDTARLVADWAAGPQSTNFDCGNAREPGWMTKLVMGAYLVTQDTYYLNAAKIILDKEHDKSVASGDHGFYYHKLDSGHCDCPKEQKHSGEAGFMVGVLMTGMTMYYYETGDERVADDIVKAARFVVDTMWVPEVLAFRYTSCPKTGPTASSSWIMMQGLAFAARRSGDAALADVCRKALGAAWNSLPSTGKSAGYVLCSSAPALQEFAQMGGVSFGEYRAQLDRVLRSPARRQLPTNVPNPDFEISAEGWPARTGMVAERVTSVQHSGQASLRISGKCVRQGEFVNTAYDATGNVYELTWLKPGQKHRLTAWVRVDKLSKGAPAPSLRLVFRDGSGSRDASTTSAYDLAQMGTWQKLTADAEVPAWNTRNYVALNTNTRDEVETEMYLDDVSLVPVDLARGDGYGYHRFDPNVAALSGGASVKVDPLVPTVARIAGPGVAEWKTDVAQPGTWSLWACLESGVGVPNAEVNGQRLPVVAAPAEPTWVRLGTVELPAGPVTVRLSELPAVPAVGRVVLTDDPSSNL